MLFRLLAKKHVKEILYLLNEKGEFGFGEIRDTFEYDKSNLSKLMKELEETGIVSRREESHELKIPKSYFKLTNKGKEVLKLYEFEERIRTDKF
jgi:DNA-binding HxlR family transcriptional regulator